VLRIGGCFMSGRYFAVPLLVSVAVLAAIRLSGRPSPIAGGAGVVLVILVGLCGPRPSVLTDGRYDWDWQLSYDAYEIGDERASLYQATGLLRAGPRYGVPNKPATYLGLAAAANNVRVLTGTIVMGLSGFHAGPTVHVVDVLGLADPLLGRLPARDARFRIGHFERFVPDGYLEGLRAGRNELTDMRLRQYYDKLRLITAGPIFSAARLTAILRMNLGCYDHLIDREYYRHPPARLRFEAFISDTDRDTAVLNTRLAPVGAWLDFNGPRHTRTLHVTVSSTRDWHLIYPRGDAAPLAQVIPARPQRQAGQEIPVPPEISEAGFDRLLIEPGAGDESFFIEKVRVPASP
jgi:arabinofuranosyltransferase